MPEASQKKIWPPGGPGGRVNGGSRGASFLKICILGIFGDISSNLSWDRCQKPPKTFFDPQGAQGASKWGAAGGDSFLKICILGIFGHISSNLSWDRRQKPPQKFLTPGGPGGASKRGQLGASFLKICILCIFGNISSNLSICLSLESLKFLLFFFHKICVERDKKTNFTFHGVPFYSPWGAKSRGWGARAGGAKGLEGHSFLYQKCIFYYLKIS